MRENKTKLLPISFPPTLHAQVIAKSKAENIPVAAVVRVVLQKWVDGKLKVKIAA